jgi:predicted esterase
VFAVLVAGAVQVVAQSRGSSLDAAWDAYWRAPDVAAAAKAATAIVAARPEFRNVYDRLKTGRPYVFGRLGDLSSPPLVFAPTGATSTARRNIRGLWHPYLYVVPRGYNPTRRYPVRFYLQGDTTRPASSAESGVRWLNYETLAREDAIVVFPGAWNGLPWWSAAQAEHMAAVLDEVKRSYNVDENRVVLIGSSDGGTAVYYHALVAPTPWAAFLPFNADPGVLANPATGVDTQLHASNLAGKPLLAIHGGRDQIYPVAMVRSWLRLFEASGASVTFRLKERFGHETRWWSEEAPSMDAFIAGHVRDPLPDAVSWETADTGRSGRMSWVIVNELGIAAHESAPVTPNEIVPAAAGIGVGLFIDTPDGLRISMIQPGSIADAYGLRDGDVIRRMDDRSISSFADVEQALAGASGRRVPIAVTRGQEQVDLTIVLPPVPEARPTIALPRGQPSGRIDVERRGNTVDVRTRGVRKFTLLLSPDEFDFSRPIVVRANGAVVAEAMSSPRVDVLLEWAARDNDRTMLFAQELEITLDGGQTP